MIGAYIGKYVTADTLYQRRWMWFLIYLASGLLWGVFTMWQAYSDRLPLPAPHWITWSYNNPILLICACCFFMFMMSFRFKSQVVNWLASSALAVYILQEGVIRYDYIGMLADRYSPAAMIGIWIACSVVFFVSALLFDKLRVLLFRPFWKLYDSTFPDKQLI